MKEKIGELRGRPIVVAPNPNEVLKHEISVEIDRATNKIKDLKERKGNQLISLLDIEQSKEKSEFSADIVLTYNNGSSSGIRLGIIDAANNRIFFNNSIDFTSKDNTVDFYCTTNNIHLSDTDYHQYKIVSLEGTTLSLNLKKVGETSPSICFSVLNKTDKVIDFLDSILQLNSSNNKVDHQLISNNLEYALVLSTNGNEAEYIPLKIVDN